MKKSYTALIIAAAAAAAAISYLKNKESDSGESKVVKINKDSDENHPQGKITTDPSTMAETVIADVIDTAKTVSTAVKEGVEDIVDSFVDAFNDTTSPEQPEEAHFEPETEIEDAEPEKTITEEIVEQVEDVVEEVVGETTDMIEAFKNIFTENKELEINPEEVEIQIDEEEPVEQPAEPEEVQQPVETEEEPAVEETEVEPEENGDEVEVITVDDIESAIAAFEGEDLTPTGDFEEPQQEVKPIVEEIEPVFEQPVVNEDEPVEEPEIVTEETIEQQEQQEADIHQEIAEAFSEMAEEIEDEPFVEEDEKPESVLVEPQQPEMAAFDQPVIEEYTAESKPIPMINAMSEEELTAKFAAEFTDLSERKIASIIKQLKLMLATIDPQTEYIRIQHFIAFDNETDREEFGYDAAQKGFNVEKANNDYDLYLYSTVENNFDDITMLIIQLAATSVDYAGKYKGWALR